MGIEEAKQYRFLVNGWSCQTTVGVEFMPGDEFFTKEGQLRKGWMATNQL